MSDENIIISSFEFTGFTDSFILKIYEILNKTEEAYDQEIMEYFKNLLVDDYCWGW